ncbi:MAG: hypothetical protein AABY39_06640 [Nitrospirota bacterium]
MPLIKTEKQKDNLAKYLFDVSKITLVGLGVPIIKLLEGTDVADTLIALSFASGIFATGISFFWAYTLDGKKLKRIGR